MTETQEHIPVLLAEVIEALAPKDGGIYVDGTFGRGGYTRALLEAAQTKVIGIDRDPQAIAAGQEMLQAYGDRFTLLEGPFSEMEALLEQINISSVDGIALDLGVSSPQLDEADRGFSFQEDGPLDMRMSKSGQTAADIVNKASEKELADIIFHFGDERFARRVARTIVAARKKAPLTRTKELADLVSSVVPRSKDGVHPATRTFQALRIAVNEELDELKKVLTAAEKLLNEGGHLAVVSFHSLEDRCTKAFMRDRSDSAPRTSRHYPELSEEKIPSLRLLTRKPIGPSEEEIARNPRSRSARLRVAQRLGTEKAA